MHRRNAKYEKETKQLVVTQPTPMQVPVPLMFCILHFITYHKFSFNVLTVGQNIINHKILR